MREFHWHGGHTARSGAPRQEKCSRTCWMTRQPAGTRFRVSVTSSPNLRKPVPPSTNRPRAGAHDPVTREMVRQMAPGRLVPRERRDCDRLVGLRHDPGGISSRSSSWSSSCSMRALRSDDVRTARAGAGAISSFSRSISMPRANVGPRPPSRPRAAPRAPPGSSHGLQQGRRAALRRVRAPAQMSIFLSACAASRQPNAVGRQLSGACASWFPTAESGVSLRTWIVKRTENLTDVVPPAPSKDPGRSLIRRLIPLFSIAASEADLPLSVHVGRFGGSKRCSEADMPLPSDKTK